MDLLKVPLDGLMNLLGGLTGGGGGGNRGANGRYYPDDPFSRHPAGPGGQAPVAMTMDQVVRIVYNSAKESLRDPAGEQLPLKRSFLHGTWISYYKCEFNEEQPHVVRWIDVRHPLVMFFHWHQLTVTARCLKSVVRPYGNIALYAENDVQRFLGYLVAFCDEYGLPLAPEPEDPVDQPPPPEEESDTAEPASTQPDAPSSFTDVSLEDGAAAAETSEDWVDQELPGIEGEMGIYVRRVYQEIVVTQSDPRRLAPRYQDIFYNMSCTAIRVSPHETRKYWWMDSKHAYTAHPLMQSVRPADRFNASYGRCSVYEDADVQRVVDALHKEFVQRGLEIDVQPIQLNGRGHMLNGAPVPVFGATANGINDV